ncbi:pyridoxal phosphate-dependent transferase, partial [Xylariales sp. PMI_506]
MQDIPSFKIDRWVSRFKADCNVFLHGSCAAELSLKQLKELCPDPTASPVDLDLPLTYGSVLGSTKLRARVAELHSTPELKLTADNVVITPGSIMANYLVLTMLLTAGDHVVCQYPTYAQLYVLPQYLGVKVDLWKSQYEDNWIPSIDELEKLIKPNTKVIII